MTARMRSLALTAPLLFWLCALAGAVEPPPPSSVPSGLLAAYARIQQALAADSLEGVMDAGRTVAIACRAEGLNLSRAAEVAEQLAAAADLKSARRAFRQLSAALVAWLDEAHAAAPGYHLAYCPMADAQWLQTDTTIQNPYYGHAMLRCGVIERDL
jgi:hypothetical protein